MFYSFYGIYTKIFIIFGSVPTFLHNFKFQAFLNKKGKGETTLCCARPACSAHAHGPSARHTRALRALPPPHAVTDGRVPPVRPSAPFPLCRTLTRRPHPSAPPSRAAALPRLRPPLARVSARVRVRIGFASTSRPR